MKSFFIDIFRRNIYLLLTAFGLFISGYLLNLYFSSDASVSVLRNHIQSLLQKRQRDFDGLTHDTALISRLTGQVYSRPQLETFLDKKYGIFLYTLDSIGEPATLRFWNDQRSEPTSDMLYGPDSSAFLELPNGQYEFVRRNLTTARKEHMIAIALIPVRWQYYISNSNLRPEFVDNSSAEERVSIVSNPTEFPVRGNAGNILFYLQKKPGYHAPAHNWTIPVVVLLATLLLLIIIHNIAHSIRERWGPAWGIGFLIAIILLMRAMIYISPGTAQSPAIRTVRSPHLRLQHYPQLAGRSRHQCLPHLLDHHLYPPRAQRLYHPAVHPSLDQLGMDRHRADSPDRHHLRIRQYRPVAGHGCKDIVQCDQFLQPAGQL